MTPLADAAKMTKKVARSVAQTERNDAITAARQILELHSAEPKLICTAITEIGKPYDSAVIAAHAALVAKYLDHSDHVVRYQAIWFIGSWGHLPDYAPRIHEVALTDSDVYNRASAAKSLGSILQHKKDPAVTRGLLAFVEDEQEEIEVRLSAYSGLLYAWNRPDSFAFLLGDKAISERDHEFVKQLNAWTEEQEEMPQVTPGKGILRSLFHALRAGHLVGWGRSKT